MKLHNKKVRILLVGLVILTIIISVLCSFSPPDVEWTQYNVSSLTVTDVENLIAIADFQDKYGSFNSYIPVACHLNGNYIRIYCVPREATWSLTESNGSYTLTSNLDGNTYIMRSNFTETGFGMQYTGSTATIPANHLLFYRTQAGDFVRNEDYSYATGNVDNDVILDAAAAWYETYKVVNGYESAIEEAESNGYADGLEEGESIGYQDGFTDGFDTGMDYGYQFGYQDGVSTGRGEGYSHGYLAGEAAGYESGYADGYDDGYAAGEVVTEIIYRDPVEINVGEVISGISSMPQNLIGSAFGFELFGINIAGLLTTLIVLAVGGFIVGLFIKRR